MLAAMELDLQSAEWIRTLSADGPERAEAQTRLHALLVRVAGAEAARRRDRLPQRGMEELDHLVIQAANDALMAIIRKLPEYRGAARFTTWASKFAILELSTRFRRHAWRHRRVATDEAVWDRLPSPGLPALAAVENREMLDAIGRLVRDDLTARQRQVFEAAILEQVPIDVLAERLGSTRGAVYKTLHDARARLRRGLAALGYSEEVR